jgi:hypothetical protein
MFAQPADGLGEESTWFGRDQPAQIYLLRINKAAGMCRLEEIEPSIPGLPADHDQPQRDIPELRCLDLSQQFLGSLRIFFGIVDDQKEPGAP